MCLLFISHNETTGPVAGHRAGVREGTSGRRAAPEYIRNDPDVQRIVQHFMQADLPVAQLCHAPQVLAAAGTLNGRRTAAYPALAPDVAAAGAEFVDGAAVVDGQMVSARAWPDHPAWMREFIQILVQGACLTRPSRVNAGVRIRRVIFRFRAARESVLSGAGARTPPGVPGRGRGWAAAANPVIVTFTGTGARDCDSHGVQSPPPAIAAVPGNGGLARAFTSRFRGNARPTAGSAWPRNTRYGRAVARDELPQACRGRCGSRGPAVASGDRRQISPSH